MHRLFQLAGSVTNSRRGLSILIINIVTVGSTSTVQHCTGRIAGQLHSGDNFCTGITTKLVNASL